jgi:hypothetical protein
MVAFTIRSTLALALTGGLTFAVAGPAPDAAVAATPAAATRAEPVTVRGVLERLIVETGGGRRPARRCGRRGELVARSEP